MLKTIADRYPKTHHLEDGAKVTCSLMSESDREPLSKFLERLTSTDLLYLQVDITRPENQVRWLDSIAAGESVCICAYDPASLVGYASVQLKAGHKQRRGEIRVNISQGYRSRGLGRILTAEIFAISRELGLATVTARMLSDQHGAKSAFRRLGFETEETLQNHVTDPAGNTKDLLVMTAQPI